MVGSRFAATYLEHGNRFAAALLAAVISIVGGVA